MVCLANHSIELSTRNVMARRRTGLRPVMGDMARSGLAADIMLLTFGGYSARSAPAAGVRHSIYGHELQLDLLWTEHLWAQARWRVSLS